MSELEPGLGAVFHILNLFLKKKLTYKQLKQLAQIAEYIENYEEHEVENLVRLVLKDGRLHLYLFIEELGWIYNCTLTKPSRKLFYSDK